jgi:hypothetical protein
MIRAGFNTDPDPALEVNEDPALMSKNCKRTSKLKEKPSALKREHPAL